MSDIEDARAKMIAKRFGGNASGASTGGGGSVRRKKKTAHKTPNTDDKKVNATLKKLGVSAIPGIEEANMFRDTGDVIHFVNPKVQASIQSNTFVISGASEVKQIHELFPGIINQLGPDGVNSLRQLAQSYAATTGATGAGAADEDEDIPDLVEGNFEEVSKK